MATPDDYFDRVDHGDGIGPYANIFLYPNNSTVDENWVGMDGPVTNAAVDGVQQLYSYDAVEWYEVWKLESSEDYPNNDDSDKLTFSDQFQNYLENHPDYYQFTGLHYGIGGDFDGGGGPESITKVSETAFETNATMVIGTGSGAKDRIQTFTKQEMIHAYMAAEVVESTDLIKDDLGDDHEHDTGLVRRDNGNITPMAITYQDSHAKHGRCANSDFVLGYSPTYTDCTKEAVRLTKQEV